MGTTFCWIRESEWMKGACHLLFPQYDMNQPTTLKTAIAVLQKLLLFEQQLK
jgi:hypothetical protein